MVGVLGAPPRVLTPTSSPVVVTLLGVERGSMFTDACVIRRGLLMGGTMRRTFAFALVVALTVLGDAAIVGMSSAGAASHAKAHHSVEAKKKHSSSNRRFSWT